MKCIQCGIELPDHAKFCLTCGTAQQFGPVERRFCALTCRQIGERWSLFGKEIWRFEAIALDGTLIEVSDAITITGFELDGPNERNRKHRAAFDTVVNKLVAAGWKKDSTGNRWYELGFCHQ